MNFRLIIIVEYIAVAVFLIIIFWRDQRYAKYWLGRHRLFTKILIGLLSSGIIIALITTLIFPYILITSQQIININKLSTPLRVAWVSDIQVGTHKQTAWVEKITQKIIAAQPDIIILGGDLIDNSATFIDESVFLEPLARLSAQYPTYAVSGNHEYGIGNNSKDDSRWQTGDRSDLVNARLQKLNIKVLLNQLDCPIIKKQTICLFGIDDIWRHNFDFNALKNWPTNTPLIFITHNPDGILFWPDTITAPDLVLAGHTHGGQIFLPIIGPLGSAGVTLGRQFYRGLNYWHNIPIYTSVGAGESGGPIRFGVAPEIVILNIQ